MLRNYLTVAVRHLLRQKLYSFINVFGLAVGMAGCVLIGLVVRHELTFDRFHEKAERIYRVIRETRPSGSHYMGVGTSGALAGALEADFPQVEKAVRLHGPNRVHIEYDERVYWRNMVTADREILDVFTFPFVKGDPATAMADPANAVITEELAALVFGDEDPIGKVLKRGGTELKIAGVIRDMPAAASLRFDILRAVDENPRWNAWTEWRPHYSFRPIRTYVLLREGADAGDIERQLPDFIARYMGEEVAASTAFHLQELTRVHLYSRDDYGLVDSRVDTEGMDESTAFYSDITYVRMFGLMAAFLLLVAAMNFIILTTARSARRMREVGVRKTLGAARNNLVRQFLAESILLAALAMVLAVCICEAALPALSAYLSRDLSLDALRAGDLFLALAASAVLIGGVAGFYPAFFLSNFEPSSALKASAVAGPGGAGVRKGLIVVQFGIAILLLIGTAVVDLQTRFLRSKYLGFSSEQVVIVPIFSADSSLRPRYNTVKQAFLEHPNVVSASACAPHPGLGTERRVVFPQGEAGRQWQMQIMGIDEDFLETFDMELVAGRGISAAIPSDRGEAYILNEMAVRQLGWEDPIGKSFHHIGARKEGQVVGVVRDFHMRSLHQPVEPIFLCVWSEMWYLVCRVKGEDIEETLAFMEGAWGQFVEDLPFSYYFLDERIDRMYRAEIQLSETLAFFSLLAVFVACLGLFGLVAFIAEGRTREIGIRKVLGASAAGIVALLSRSFFKLVLLANLLAWPIALLVMERWLQDFPYRIELSAWLFFGSGFLAMVIAMGTVGYQAMKAARTNPVEALKCE